MLKFTDNQKIEHVFNLENLVHVHVRKSDEKNVTLTMQKKCHAHYAYAWATHHSSNC